MSWEVLSEVSIAVCPCGKGELIRTHKQDDWFQNKETDHLTCPECSAKRYSYVAGRWMTPAEVVAYNAEVAERRRQADEEVERRHEALRREFGPPLLAALADSRSRKAVYEELRKLIPVAGSFHAFNRHWREGGRERGRERAILSAIWVPQNVDALKKRFGDRAR